MASSLTAPQQHELYAWKRKLKTREKAQKKVKELELVRYVEDLLKEPDPPAPGFIPQGKRGN